MRTTATTVTMKLLLHLIFITARFSTNHLSNGRDGRGASWLGRGVRVFLHFFTVVSSGEAPLAPMPIDDVPADHKQRRYGRLRDNRAFFKIEVIGVVNIAAAYRLPGSGRSKA